MKRKNIFVLCILFVLIVIILGILGISKNVCFEAGDCKQCYKHYTIRPFLSDFFDCGFPSGYKTPCSKDWTNSFVCGNTKSLVAVCLCKNIPQNNELILSFFNNIIIDKSNTSDCSVPPSWQGKTNATEVCNSIMLGGLQ